MKTPAEPDVAIVIVNYRTSELVDTCLASVLASCGALTLETVIVDNASGDGSVERLREAHPYATVVAMPDNRGFAAGVNAGFLNSRAELVVVLNPDTELRPGALTGLVGALLGKPHTGVLAPLLEDGDGRLAPNGYRRFPGLFTLALDLCVPFSYALSLLRMPGLHPYAMSPAALLAGRRPAHVTGAVMAIRRTAYQQAGPFDEGFFLYLEETEWQQRVTVRGWEIELLPTTRARHLMRGGGDQSLAHSPYFLTSSLRYLRLQGVPVGVSRAVLAVPLALSWLTLRAIAWLPAKRARAMVQARAYRSLLREALTGDAADATPAHSSQAFRAPSPPT